jgi:hypothetical protein
MGERLTEDCNGNPPPKTCLSGIHLTAVIPAMLLFSLRRIGMALSPD